MQHPPATIIDWIGFRCQKTIWDSVRACPKAARNASNRSKTRGNKPLHLLPTSNWPVMQPRRHL